VCSTFLSVQKTVVCFVALVGKEWRLWGDSALFIIRPGVGRMMRPNIATQKIKKKKEKRKKKIYPD